MALTQVSEVIDALNLIGSCYRSKDGSKPAEPILKILAQLHGHEALTLAAWVNDKKSPAQHQKKKSKSARVSIEPTDIQEILKQLEAANTQAAVKAITDALQTKFSVSDWKVLGRQVSGKAQKSGKAAKETIEDHFSDRLLLKQRMAGVKHVYGR